MVAAVLPPPITFQGYTQNGHLNAFGFVATYAAGTNTPIATYTDATQAQVNQNPVPLNAIGQAAIWLAPGIGYKFVETDQLGNQCGFADQINGSGAGISTNLFPAINNSFTLGTPALSWSQLYVANSPIVILRTQAELASAAIPVNFQYPPGSIDRYGTNTSPGVTSMATALQAAVNQKKNGGADITCGLTAPYLIDSAIDGTTAVGATNYGIVIRGVSGQSLAVTDNAPFMPILIFKTSGHAFDTTGSLGITVENLSVTTDLVTFPLTCFLLARNSNGNSRSDRFTNVRVYGLFQNTIIYNYGAENDQFTGCSFYNVNPAANTSVFDITSNNIRGLSSSFTTIASGNQSCLDHKIFGGELANFAGTATSDVIRLESCRSVKLYGPWMDSSTQSASASGRSLIYIDGTIGPTQIVELMGIDGEEASSFPATYGIFFSSNVQTHSNFVVIGNTFPNITAMLGGGTGATLSQFTWFNNTNQSVGGGVNFLGTLSNAQIDSTSGGVIGTPAGYNETWGVNQGISVPGEANFGLRDTTQVSGSQITKIRSAAGGITISSCDNSGNVTANLLSIPMGSAVSGWGTPSGQAVQNGYAGGSATLVQTSAAVAQIISTMIARGFFAP